MKKKRDLLLSCFLGVTLLFSCVPSYGGGEEKAPEKLKVPKKTPSEKGKGMAQDEIKDLKEGVKEAGRSMKESAKELPAKAGKEFKKTGAALKETGKELKESTKETIEDLKKLIKK